MRGCQRELEPGDTYISATPVSTREKLRMTPMRTSTTMAEMLGAEDRERGGPLLGELHEEGRGLHPADVLRGRGVIRVTPQRAGAHLGRHSWGRRRTPLMGYPRGQYCKLCGQVRAIW